MKKIVLFFFSLALFSCQQSVSTTVVKPITPITNQDIAQAVLYEVNIRQFTNEGTFNAFAKELPKVKELGVNILWFMPTFPISTTKSKGPLGSYYAVSDFKGVNPEYGRFKRYQDNKSKRLSFSYEYRMKPWEFWILKK